jgi:MFS transporter, DHA2 family, multidrug resistance protein
MDRAALTAADASASARATPAIRTWIGFATMCVGMFMAILDVQVVATSLPAMQQALSIAPDLMSWVQTAYLIAEVVAISLTGFLTRLLGMRRLFVIAICVFTAASVACAASSGLAGLLAWRVVQGFAGGTLIPAVFSAVFLLFPQRGQTVATMLAGVLAVLAPTIGPVVGGWITQTYTWHWLFLINVLPGMASAALAAAMLPRMPAQWREARRLDLASLVFIALALAALEIGLKEAPGRGWLSGLVAGLLLLSACSMAAFLMRTRHATHPVVGLQAFGDRNFAIGCVLSFVFGIGLFGSVYLMPVFLGFVKGRNALQIGVIMLATGVAQLCTAPVAVALERRLDPRLLSGAGFVLFALGLALSSTQTIRTDGDAMFWPQVVRGVAIMFCLLPPTRLALHALDPDRVPDASALFNLMRNLGGAIGLALIDTVLYGRAPVHANELVARLGDGDPAAAQAIGVPLAWILRGGPGPIDTVRLALMQPRIERAALTQAINEAWLLMAVLTIAAALLLPWARRSRSS